MKNHTLVVVVLLVLLNSRSSMAQYALERYVCQIPPNVMWCAFAGPSGVSQGYPCFCTTLIGRLNGFTIVTQTRWQQPQAPQAPRPSPTPKSPGTRPGGNSTTEQTDNSDDCFHGLGNCAGAYSADQ